MDCPHCKTYNPDERTTCWRCDKPLPKVQPKKKKAISSQQWLYIIVAVMFGLLLLQMCGVRVPGMFQAPSSGLAAPLAGLSGLL